MTTESREAAIVNVDMRRLINVVFWLCVGMEVFLVLADYVFNYLDVFDDRSMRRIWNIAREESIPSWFSSIQAQLLGVTVLLTALVLRGRESGWRVAAWATIGLFFFWVGLDDYAQLHERLGGIIERALEGDESGALSGFLQSFPSYSWHAFVAPVFILLGLGTLAFISRTFWRLRLLHFVILGFGCWGFAQGLDFLEGLDNVDSFYGWFQVNLSIERDYGVPHTFKVIEETLEMFGTTLLWVAFLRYFAHVTDGMRFVLKRGAAA